jgi:hypothetical protein
MTIRIQGKRLAALAALAAASLAAPQAATTTRANGTSAPTPGTDTAYSRPYWDSTAGGTGMGATPGIGGSSRDSAYGRDTLFSSPYDQPATPGTGLPNSPGNSPRSGSGNPGAGTGPGTGSGANGSGVGGSGTGSDSGAIPGGTPGNDATPHDSIGAPDLMERG